jgi:polyisoprenoid-binding protein YceI
MNSHAKNADMFNVEKFPTITYKSKLQVRRRPTGGVEGELTMLGVTKPVSAESRPLQVHHAPALQA